MRNLLLVSLTILFVIGCGPERQKMASTVMSMMDDSEAMEEPFGDVPRIAVSDAIMQDKITGPWLWMIAPTEPGKGGANSIDIDSLAVASDGTVTEIAIATNGVAEGDMVGDLTWTLGTIQSSWGNVNQVVNEIGLAEGDLDHHSSYALISLVSATDQSDVTMQVGSDDSIKVWLNGEVVHNNPVHRAASDFQDEFMVDLKAGDNLLLVKVSEGSGSWVMLVGIEDPSNPMPIMEEPVAEEVVEEEPVIAVSDAIMQDKITGPWLWMIAPTEPGKGGANSIDIDSLAVASDGTVTEIAIATNGVAEGDMVGDLTWTLGTIQSSWGNVNQVVNEIGLAEGDLDHHSSYALISLVSATDQSDVTMQVGSDDSIKVWLNGEVVHNNPVHRAASDFQDEFMVDLKAGDNLLLVKVSEGSGSWVMLVGIEDPSNPMPIMEEPVAEEAIEEEVVEDPL